MSILILAIYYLNFVQNRSKIWLNIERPITPESTQFKENSDFDSLDSKSLLHDCENPCK